MRRKLKGKVEKSFPWYLIFVGSRNTIIRTLWENWAPTENWHWLYQTFRDSYMIAQYPFSSFGHPEIIPHHHARSTFAGSKAPIAEKNFHLLLPSDEYFTICEGQDQLNGKTRRCLADRNDSMVWRLRFWNKSLLFFGIYGETTKGKGLIMLGRP